MADLVLHIGSHKTGTSSIQYVLSRCQRDLEQQDAAYLLPHRGIAGNASSLIETSGRLETFGARVLPRRADRLFRPRKTTNIVSAEGFFWLSDPKEVTALAELIRSRFARITVLAYLRRQDLLAVSHRSQVISESPALDFYGLRAHPLPEYRPHLKSYFDYAGKLIDLWGGAFGIENILPIPYEPWALKDRDVVADFCKRVGLSLAAKHPVRRNTAFGLEQSVVALKLAELKVPKKIRRAVLWRLGKTGKFLPTKREAQDFLGHFSQSNARLEKQFNAGDEPFRFDESFDMYPETEGELWNTEKVARIIEVLAASNLCENRGPGGRIPSKARASGGSNDDRQP